ncbi:DUF4331 domain-containing protein [Hyphococcus flavus]|uniref:DUF4331 domain-containing protein n=1 Tax=Hyphococcus flavus TaxID=1866326 RepID=A0AAF0CFP9_9PROT|nr:DUF4331 domain-containing protein [Hyphococcus flavus]WDI32681.1 DUF4331 domain-containing protein [Hyphococcus flavus]
MNNRRALNSFLIGGLAAMAASPVFASSHMDAPRITLDDAANTTDVYAFISQDAQGRQYLTTALAVYPFQEPGVGPNNYQFDERVRYSIHVSLEDAIAEGEPSISYHFDFSTAYANDRTIRQAFLGPIDPAGDGAFPANQNLRQTYAITMEDHRTRRDEVIGDGLRDGLIVPVNNQGLLTRFYNQNDDGDMPAKEGVASNGALDPYTASAVAELKGGYVAFAGQRDDGFYADIQSIFDLDFSFGANTGTPSKPFDSQGGYNVHTIVFNIPLDALNIIEGRGVNETSRPAQIAGVYATTARSRFNRARGPYDQAGRQGNPLFVEALLPLSQKDQYNEGLPEDDAQYGDAVDNPELLALLGGSELIPGLLRSIFIPDMIKVDLTTGPARLAGGESFNRLGVFGGDVLQSQFQDPFGNGGLIPGGWPNGRRFGDDVIDIAIIALGLAGPGPDFSGVEADRVSENDITYNQVFPYAATPLNGRAYTLRSSGDASSGE